MPAIRVAPFKAKLRNSIATAEKTDYGKFKNELVEGDFTSKTRG
jgi:hypothetical protein